MPTSLRRWENLYLYLTHLRLLGVKAKKCPTFLFFSTFLLKLHGHVGGGASGLHWTAQNCREQDKCQSYSSVADFIPSSSSLCLKAAIYFQDEGWRRRSLTELHSWLRTLFYCPPGQFVIQSANIYDEDWFKPVFFSNYQGYDYATTEHFKIKVVRLFWWCSNLSTLNSGHKNSVQWD